jgi:hypothetical protein
MAIQTLPRERPIKPFPALTIITLRADTNRPYRQNIYRKNKLFSHDQHPTPSAALLQTLINEQKI